MATLLLPFLAGSTAPVDNLVFTLTGPFTTFTVTAPSGDAFTYGKPVGVGETVVIDTGAGTLAGTGGHLADPSQLTYTGASILLLNPSATPQVDWASDGGSIRVDGAPMYAT